MSPLELKITENSSFEILRVPSGRTSLSPRFCEKIFFSSRERKNPNLHHLVICRPIPTIRHLPLQYCRPSRCPLSTCTETCIMPSSKKTRGKKRRDAKAAKANELKTMAAAASLMEEMRQLTSPNGCTHGCPKLPSRDHQCFLFLASVFQVGLSVELCLHIDYVFARRTTK